MLLRVVGSNSDGNSYLLQDNDHFICLDCGRPWKEIQKASGYKTSQIDAALITHEHGDHSAYYKDFIRRGIDCYTGAEQAANLGSEALRTLSEKKCISINGWRVLPFGIPHDGIPNFAYVIQRNDHTLCYATDFEYLPFTLKSFGINTWLIECNHSLEIEEFSGANNFEHVIRGHSSLETVKTIIIANLTDSMKNIICCHLSAKNSDAGQIIRELATIVPETVNICIAQKGSVFEL